MDEIVSIQNTPQETTVTLQFPEFLKSLYRVYLTCVVLLPIIVVGFIGDNKDLDGFFGVFFFVGFLSFITGLISSFKCFRHRNEMAQGEKIIGWSLSIFTVTIIPPILLLFLIMIIIGRTVSLFH